MQIKLVLSAREVQLGSSTYQNPHRHDVYDYYLKFVLMALKKFSCFQYIMEQLPARFRSTGRQHMLCHAMKKDRDGFYHYENQCDPHVTLPY